MDVLVIGFRIFKPTSVDHSIGLNALLAIVIGWFPLTGIVICNNVYTLIYFPGATFVVVA